jgi:hypothetical protein
MFSYKYVSSKITINLRKFIVHTFCVAVESRGNIKQTSTKVNPFNN